MAKKAAKTKPDIEATATESVVVDQGWTLDSSESVKVSEALAPFTHFQFTKAGLIPNGRPPFEEWELLGKRLSKLDKTIQWMVGDWLNIGESYFGEEHAQGLDTDMFSESTLRVYGWVCKKVAPSVRRPGLSFSHHQLIAELSPVEQAEWLDKAAVGTDGEPWSSATLKKAIKAASEPAEPKADVDYGVMVPCDSPDDQDVCLRQLENLGRTKCKKVEHGK